MEFDTAELSQSDVYKLLTGCIVPPPIAWVSTVDTDEPPNLAPFSFFNGVCSHPPTILFCPGIRATDNANTDNANTDNANTDNANTDNANKDTRDLFQLIRPPSEVGDGAAGGG